MTSRDPSSSALERAMAGLSPERRELLEKLLAGERTRTRARAQIAALPRDGRPLPVSFSQRRLWLLSQLEPDDLSYSESSCFELSGELDRSALERSVSEIVARHEALRSVFDELNGEPVVRVLPPEPITLTPIELSEAEALHRTELARRRGFDLGRGPLFRAELFRVRADCHLLAVTLHHIIADGWSLGVFLAELVQLYGAFVAGRPSPLPPLAIQYPDYAAWQRERVESGDLSGQLQFWTERLAGCPSALELPLDRARPPSQTYRGGKVVFTVSEATSAELYALAARAGATPFMLLLAALSTLLSRWSGEDDIVVGTPVANRLRDELMPLVGFFLNSVALRTRLGDDPTFSTLLERVRSDSLAAFANQELPFEKVLDALRPNRDLSRTPLFQVLLNMLDFPPFASKSGELSLAVVPSREQVARFDLTFYARARRQLEVELVYNADLFEHETAVELSRQLTTLLGAIASNPGARISELPLLPSTAPDVAVRRARVPPHPSFVAFEPRSVEGTIHARFEEIARQFPERVAVRTENASLCYAELDQAANRLANLLLGELGPGSERVGLVLGSDAEMVVAVLGVLKAGKAYVPLDPSFPAERLRDIALDAQLRAVVTSATHLSVAEALGKDDARIFSLAESETESPSAPAVRVEPSALAYLLYTSGSTGKPKGVMQSHAGVLRHMRAYTNALGIGHGDVLSLLSTFGFDAAVMDIFGALLNGACLAPYSVRTRGIAGIGAFVRSTGITVLHSTPTLFRYLVRELETRRDVEHVRLVVLGGEEAVRDDVTLVRDWFPPGCVLVNGLGPTESTLALQFVTTPERPLSRRSLPIGFPVEGMEVLLLDRRGRPTDVRGEIALRSEAVALGYWNRPAETAAAFQPDPDGRTRLYKTGDLARRLPDGSLEYLGRKDAQVKVRGYRIELGELESALALLPGVRAVASAVRADASGEPALVAYLVPAHRNDVPDLERLRTELGRALPEFMLPSALVVLDALPLTTTGKLDRSALPQPSFAPVAEGEAPATELERLVATIYAETLGVERVARDTDFFTLGGHSLSAMRVVARLRSALGVELPIRALFEAPRVRQLALRLETLERAGNTVIPRVDRDASLPLSFAQERLWFLHQLQPENSGYNVPLVLRIRGHLDVAVVESALTDLVYRHETLRTTFMNDPLGRCRQVVQPPTPVSIRVLETERADELERLVALETERPFDLVKGPLFHAVIIRIASDECVLCLTVHHIAFDVWSAGVLVRDLVELCVSRTEQRAPELPELTIQYADFAVWQRARLEGPRMEAELDHWRECLNGLEALELPTDRPRPAEFSGNGACHRFEVDAETVRGLEQLARAEGATLFMTLLGALGWMLGRHAGQNDVAIGTPIAGRTEDTTHDLIGFFVNTLVMRMKLQPRVTGRGLVALAREVAFDAFAHQELPFERLVDALSPSRDLSRGPLFQVMLVLQNAPQGSLAIPGLSFEPIPPPIRSARLDLTFVFTESAGKLEARVEYATDLFDAATVETLTERLRRVLEALSKNADAALSTELLLDSGERGRLLELASGARRDPSTGATLTGLFEAQAKRTPDATAVVFAGERLSYAELDARATRLGAVLSRSGAGPETVVAVLLERSPALIVALLAVLKSGAAYLPLDPSHPRERLGFQAKNSAARILVSTSRLAETLPCFEHVIDVDAPVSSDSLDAAPPQARHDRALAYVIYTSGSTGQPKGVCIDHRGAVNTILAAIDELALGPASRVLQFASIAFDGSVWEIWSALLAGATLYVAPQVELMPGEDLAHFTSAHAITHLALMPNALSMMPAGSLETVETLLVAGEASSLGLTKTWAAGRVLFNAYGPTETSITATMGRCTTDDDRVTIGRPIPGAEVYVLDATLELSPIGAIGELCVGGRGLGRGYAARPDLTAERFVPHPFATGERLYRTGDLCRLLPDGRLEFVGRADHQVKLRGFRIELGEIEAELERHEAVRDAVVVLYRDPLATRATAQLVAHVVLTDTDALASVEERLRQKLPAYMVPSAFVVLDRMPTNAVGKIDKKRLPAPTFAASGEHVAPRTTDEVALAKVFADVLGLDQVGIHDPFFALGGDSILSIQVVSRARALGFAFTVRDLFDRPTVGELAGLGRVAIEVEPRPSGVVPLTPIQRWFFARNLEKPSHFNQAVAVQTREPLDEQALDEAVAALGEHHDALRLRFAKDASGDVHQYYVDAAGITTEHLDLSALEPSERTRALTERSAELQASLDLEHGPVFRVLHARLGAEAGERLIFVAHHLIVDGVSWRILLEDLIGAYSATSRGAVPVLPPKTASFKRWAELQQSLAKSPELAAERDYWNSILERLPDVPTPARASTVASAERITGALDPDETRVLFRDAARTFRASPNDLLLTAWTIAYARFAGTTRVALDLESHGRSAPGGLDLSRSVGWFTTFHPLVIDLPEEHDAQSVLREVKRELSRVPGAGIGHGILRHLVLDGATLARARGPLVLFNYFGQLDTALGDSVFAPAEESTGPATDAGATRSHPLEVNAAVVGGALSVHFTYAPELWEESAIARLRDEFTLALRTVIGASQKTGTHGYTPADFPLAKLTWKALDELANSVCSAPEAGADPIEDIYPLSPLQEGILFHALEAPDTSVYTTPVAVRIDGELDRAAFRRAWEKVVARHPILRTSFRWEGLDAPVQVVHRRVSLPWQERSQPSGAHDLIAADRAQPFDLTSAPLMRMTLIELAPTAHVFVWTHHHLLIDGWSTAPLVREVFDAYEAELAGRAREPRPAFRFRDYIAWLGAKSSDGARDFWTELLRGFRIPTPIAPGGSMTRRRTRDVEERRRDLGSELTTRLEGLARATGCTLATLVQAAWAVLIARYADASDVVLGVTVAGRPPELPGIESAIGLFINAVPLRARVEPNKPVDALLAELRAELVAINEWEHESLTSIQGHSEVARATPLFDSLLVFQNFPLDAALSAPRGGLRLTSLASFVKTNYAVVLVGIPGRELSLRLRHDTSLFSAAQAEVALEQLETILEQFARDPRQTLASVTLSSQREAALLPDPTEPLEAPRYEPITQIIGRFVERAPASVAVSQSGRNFSYAEIGARSTGIAHELQQRGVKRGDVVAIAGQQSFGLIAALIGVLEAGAVMLTLDSKLPNARIELMLQKANAKLLIRVGACSLVHEATLDIDPHRSSVESALPRLPPPSPEDPAYVFFTSGTTGVPRAVLGRHAGLAHFLAWQRQDFAIGPDDRCGQLTGLSFNVLLRSVFLPLTSGGTLCLPEDLDDLSAERVLPWLEAERISVLHVVPTLTQSWLAHRPRGFVQRHLRHAFSAGEPLVDTLVHDFRQAFPAAEVVVLYGQTETTMAKCFARLGAELPRGPQPVGRPLPSTQALVLDASGRMCGISQLGQVGIRTPFRTLGYLNAPEDNAARFVPNPFRADATDLIYLTGDRGYYLPDGTLQLVGRVDDQLKIWGVRVEPGEVAAALSTHPDVREAFVAVRASPNGTPALVAWVVADNHPAERELRAHVAGQLPAAALPAAWVYLDALPVNANGKIDRERLPVPDLAAREYVAPRTPMERDLAEIWRELLEAERIGVDDDFFALGGHSLLATRVASRIRSAFGVELPLRVLFEQPTVAAVARAVAERQLESMSDDDFEALLAEAGHDG